MLICIDSNIFIWGIKKISSAGQENMLKHTESFFKWVQSEKHDILIPSIVLAECLQPEPIEKHSEYIELAMESFQVINFGIIECLKYAEILNMDKIGDAKKIMNEIHTNREKMKIDHLILATGIANGAKSLFTNDDKFRSFASKHIEVDSVNRFSFQTEIFE